jgi:hypothetical protein
MTPPYRSAPPRPPAPPTPDVDAYERRLRASAERRRRMVRASWRVTTVATLVGSLIALIVLAYRAAHPKCDDYALSAGRTLRVCHGGYGDRVQLIGEPIRGRPMSAPQWIVRGGRRGEGMGVYYARPESLAFLSEGVLFRGQSRAMRFRCRSCAVLAAALIGGGCVVRLVPSRAGRPRRSAGGR